MYRHREKEKKKRERVGKKRLMDDSAGAVKMTDTGVNQGIFMACREGTD